MIIVLESSYDSIIKNGKLTLETIAMLENIINGFYHRFEGNSIEITDLENDIKVRVRDTEQDVRGYCARCDEYCDYCRW